MKTMIALLFIISAAGRAKAFDLPAIDAAALRGPAAAGLPAVRLAAAGPEIDQASDWADLRAGFFRAGAPAGLYSLLGVYSGHLHPLYEREDYTVPFTMTIYRDAATGDIKAVFPMPPNDEPETITLKMTRAGAEFADAWGGRARLVIRRDGSALRIFSNLYSDETYGIALEAGKLAVARLDAGAEKSVIGSGSTVLTSGCHEPVAYIRPDGKIFKNGGMIGSNAVSFKGACSGNVAWTDAGGKLYRDTALLGYEAAQYKIASGTGDVAWTSGNGRIYKNTMPLGHNPAAFEIAAVTGAVAWKSDSGEVYKDSLLLGRNALDFGVADMTGDVAWTDSAGALHKNTAFLGRGANNIRLYPDGRLLWTDGSGTYHTGN